MNRGLRVALGWMAIGCALRMILGSVACDGSRCPTEGPLAFGAPLQATYFVQSDYPALDEAELVVKVTEDAAGSSLGWRLDIQTPSGVVTYALPAFSDTDATASPPTP